MNDAAPKAKRGGPVKRPAFSFVDIKPANLEDVEKVQHWLRRSSAPTHVHPRAVPSFRFRWPDNTKDLCILVRARMTQGHLAQPSDVIALHVRDAAGAILAARRLGGPKTLPDHTARVYAEDIGWFRNGAIANLKWRLTYGRVVEFGKRRMFEPLDPRLYRLRDMELTKWPDGKFIAHLIREIDGRP